MPRPKMRYEDPGFWILTDTSLEELELSMGKQISSRVLRSESLPTPTQCSQISKLYVTSDYSASALPPWLPDVEGLTYLDVASHFVDSPQFANIAGRLRELHLRGKTDLSRHRLPSLEILGTSDEIDFDADTAPHLREIGCKLSKRKLWIRKLGRLPNLESLALSRLQPTTLSELAEIRLRTLRIHHSHIEDISGVEHQVTLRNFSAMAMPRLRDVAQLQYLIELEDIIFRYCPHLGDIEALKRLPRLARIELLNVPDESSAPWRDDPRLT